MTPHVHKKYTREAHLTCRGKTNKKIMITNHQRRNISNCPKIQSVDKVLSWSFKVLSWSSKFLSFLSLHIQHKTHEGTIFHKNNILSTAGSPLTSMRIDYSSSYNLRQPTSTVENIPNGRINKKRIHSKTQFHGCKSFFIFFLMLLYLV